MEGVLKHVTDYTINSIRKTDHKAIGSAGTQTQSPTAVVVLNYRLPRFTPLLCSQACLCVCADGGANRLYDELPQLFPNEDPKAVRERYKPDVIKGDLDSVRADVRDFYINLGTRIVDEAHDQDTTDFHKCIRYIEESASDFDKTQLKVLVVGALGGRFDHEAGNINVLWTFANSMKIVLLSEESSLTLLPAGRANEIYIDQSFEGPHCGLLPVGAPSLSTTSTGLCWNLNQTPMSFGSLISVCNIVDSDVVTVTSDVHLLWTIELRYEP